MREFDGELLESARPRPEVRPADRDRATVEAARAAVDGRAGLLPPASVLHLQRTAGNGGVAALYEDQESPVRDVVGRGAGQPLEAGVRQRMEASFGTDFSDVRLHEGGSAASSARAVDAHAYTVGNEIVLDDSHGTGSPAHERTLAHELTHVVQQRSGPVEGTPAAGGISLSSPSDRFERAAEATAESVVATGRAPGAEATAPASAVQRQAGPDDEVEDVQALAIQRRQEPEEPEEEASGPQRPPQEAGGEVAPAAQSQSGPAAEEEQEEVQALAIQRQEEGEEPVEETPA